MALSPGVRSWSYREQESLDVDAEVWRLEGYSFPGSGGGEVVGISDFLCLSQTLVPPELVGWAEYMRVLFPCAFAPYLILTTSFFLTPLCSFLQMSFVLTTQTGPNHYHRHALLNLEVLEPPRTNPGYHQSIGSSES